jgi:hypothetical protein
MKKLLGIICIIWAACFAHYETYYFGFNMFPNSKFELFCDLTALLLQCVGFVLIFQKNNTKPKQTNEPVNGCKHNDFFKGSIHGTGETYCLICGNRANKV